MSDLEPRGNPLAGALLVPFRARQVDALAEWLRTPAAVVASVALAVVGVVAFAAGVCFCVAAVLSRVGADDATGEALASVGKAMAVGVVTWLVFAAAGTIAGFSTRRGHAVSVACFVSGELLIVFFLAQTTLAATLAFSGMSASVAAFLVPVVLALPVLVAVWAWRRWLAVSWMRSGLVAVVTVGGLTLLVAAVAAVVR